MSKKTFTDNVRETISTRFLNNEYQRGYREGQEDAAAKMALIVDELLGQYDHISKHFPLDRLHVDTPTE